MNETIHPEPTHEERVEAFLQRCTAVTFEGYTLSTTILKGLPRLRFTDGGMLRMANVAGVIATLNLGKDHESVARAHAASLMDQLEFLNTYGGRTALTVRAGTLEHEVTVPTYKIAIGDDHTCGGFILAGYKVAPHVTTSEAFSGAYLDGGEEGRSILTGRRITRCVESSTHIGYVRADGTPREPVCPQCKGAWREVDGLPEVVAQREYVFVCSYKFEFTGGLMYHGPLASRNPLAVIIGEPNLWSVHM